MKYYAVTEDPNELLHYGVKGMKWGQHLFGDDLRPKSQGYKRAVSKLKATVSKAGKSPFKTSEQRAIERQRKDQEKYNRAVKNTQKRIALTEKLSTIDTVNQNEKKALREAKRTQKIAKQLEKIQNYQSASQVRMARQEAKAAKNAYKIDRKFDKVLQEAREGRLRYGKLNEEQIQRVQERLAFENSTRKLGGNEPMSWRMRKKEARREGKLEGIKKGTVASMEEVARAATLVGIQGIKNRLILNSKAKSEGKRERIKNAEKSKKTNKQIKREVDQAIKQEAYEAKARNGENAFIRNNLLGRDEKGNVVLLPGSSGNARYLKNIAEQKKLAEIAESERKADRAINDQVYKLLAAQKGGKRLNDLHNRVYGVGKKAEEDKTPKLFSNQPSDVVITSKVKNAAKDASNKAQLFGTKMVDSMFGPMNYERLYGRMATAEEEKKRRPYRSNNPLKG